MTYLKIFAFCAGCAISVSTAMAAPSYTGEQSGYNDLLLTPQPHAGNTVDSPFRAENGRIWAGRNIGAHQAVHNPGAAAYGADPAEDGRLIYVRVGHTPIAISPWNKLDKNGFEDLERARNLWLRENGYVLGVRTFINPRYALDTDAVVAEASEPKPSATIRRHHVPKGPTKMQVVRPVTGQPIARISKPGDITAPQTEVAKADEATDTDSE